MIIDDVLVNRGGTLWGKRIYLYLYLYPQEATNPICIWC